MISEFVYTAHEDTDVKTFLRKKLQLSSRTVIELKSNGLFVNEKPVRVIDKVKNGDTLTIRIDEEPGKDYSPQDIPLSVVYEDAGFAVIDKPWGMPMYPVGKHDSGSLLNAAAAKYKGMVFRPLYRLDRNTSGLTVLAKSKLTASSALIQKTYLAVCVGDTPQSGIITSPICLEQGSIIKRTVGSGQGAETSFETLLRFGGYSLIRLKLKTGRTHQIRVHMSSVGFPLAGDDLYGGSVDRIGRHCLHCDSVQIKSPVLQTEKSFFADLPRDIQLAFPELSKNQ